MKLKNLHIIILNLTGLKIFLEILFLFLILLIRPLTRPKRKLQRLKTKKILRIIHYMEVDWFGGPVYGVLSLAPFLYEKGYKQVIVCRNDGDNKEGFRRQFKELKKLGIEIVCIDLPTYWPIFNPIKIFKLALIFRKLKPDIIHIHKAHWYREKTPVLSAQIAGIPKIVNYECNAIPITRSKYINWVKGLIDNYIVDKIMIISSDMKGILKETFRINPDKISYIPNFRKINKMESKRKATVNRKYGLSPFDVSIGVAARLHPQKGHHYLLEAASMIIDEFPDTKILFAGDGPLKRELVEKSKRLKIEKNIIFLGYLDNEEMSLFHSNLDVGVLPSLNEGMPGAVLEYMAAGLPVVATAVNGTKDLVVDGVTGFLVPPKDPESLSKVIIKLLKDPKLARTMGQNGRKRVEQKFSTHVVGEKIHNVYTELISNN